MIAFFCPRQVSQLLFGTPDYARVATLSLLAAGATILNAHFFLDLMPEKRAFLYVTFSTTVTILSLGLSVLTVVFLRRGVEGMVESILVANVVALTLLVFHSARSLPFRLSGGVARELLRLGIPLIPSSFFLFILQQANQYILQ
jgi:O-antigen/teichoic acid export membrane protein